MRLKSGAQSVRQSCLPTIHFPLNKAKVLNCRKMNALYSTLRHSPPFTGESGAYEAQVWSTKCTPILFSYNTFPLNNAKYWIAGTCMLFIIPCATPLVSPKQRLDKNDSNSYLGGSSSEPHNGIFHRWANLSREMVNGLSKRLKDIVDSRGKNLNPSTNDSVRMRHWSHLSEM